MNNNYLKRKLHILNLEDNQGDHELIRAGLLREGMECHIVRIDTKDGFASAIGHGGWDLILADYSLPSFNGLAALKMAKEKCPDVPFIFVSGAIGEEIAIETLKQGATDYVLKDKLSRLPTAIGRALLEVEEQARRKRAERELERYQKHLEELVSERTAELNIVNERLETELAERRSAEEALYRREQEFEALVEHAPDIVQRFDRDMRHLYINQAVERITGARPHTFIGKTYRELGFREDVVALWDRSLGAVFRMGREKVIEYEMKTSRGPVFFEARLVPEVSRDGRIESVLSISRDITARKKLEEKLHAASITDELTGLLNRRGFLLLAQEQLAIAERNKKKLSILFLDLDGMKKINDEFGHKEGDDALIDVSNVLKKSFRKSDIIARIGGDEFTVLITDTGDATVEETVARHVQDNLSVCNEGSGRGYKLSVSMGMVYYDPERPCSVEELLDGADELMYEHKHVALKRQARPSARGTEIQKRVYERHETDDGRFAELLVWGSHMIRNISLAGISVRTSQRLTKNTVYKIRMLTAGNEELTLKGMVVWSSLMGMVSAGDGKVPYYEAGLRFIELNEDQTNSLRQFLVELAG